MTDGRSIARNYGQEVPISDELIGRIAGLEDSQKQIEIVDQYKIVVNRRIEIEIVKNDITQETTDAITNAANENLRHNGGLAAAIKVKAGANWE